MRTSHLVGIIVVLIAVCMAALFYVYPSVMYAAADWAHHKQFVKLFFGFAAATLVAVLIVRSW